MEPLICIDIVLITEKVLQRPPLCGLEKKSLAEDLQRPATANEVHCCLMLSPGPPQARYIQLHTPRLTEIGIFTVYTGVIADLYLAYLY